MAKPVILLTFANEEERFLNELKEESKAINRIFTDYNSKGYIQLVREESSTLEDLSFYLQNYHNRIFIFHYAGHASAENLSFEGGHSYMEGLAGLLSAQEQLKLVFLNGCGTKEQAEFLLNKGVKAIIATTLPIDDGKAKAFAETFYAGLCLNQTIKDAFNHAVNKLRLGDQAFSQMGDDPISTFRSAGFLGESYNTDLPWQLLISEQHAEEILNWRIPVPDKANDNIKIYPSGTKKPSAPSNNGTPKFFLMYDDEDKDQVVKLKKFLHLMKKRKELEILDMHEFDVVGDIDEEIERNIREADYVLCLITFNFLFTTYDWAEKAKALGKPIIPILINVVGLEDTFFPSLKRLPSNNKAIAEWPNEDAAYTDIVKNLRAVIKRKR